MATSIASGKSKVQDQDAIFVVTATPDSASLAIKSSVELTGHAVTEEDVRTKLTSLGIVHGIDWDRVKTLLRNKEYNQAIPIAHWTPPENGQDARMEQLIRLGHEGKPQILQDGSADFKNIDNIIQVKVGQVLATKNPPTQGRPGTDVFGNVLPQIFGKDRVLTAGVNTELIENGTKVIAKKGGFLYKNHGVLCVGETYEVLGGVNYKSGNVRFSGDVIIHGTIADGFSVEAGGSLLVNGDVEAAELKAGKGGITVTGGIFGKDKALLKSDGSITVGMVQQCHIECKELIVTKSMMHCDVKTYSLKADAPGCLVHGGKVLAYGDVSLYEAGHEGDKTEIIMLNEEEEELRGSLSKIQQEEGLLQPGIENCEKRLKQIKTMADKAGSGLPPKVAQEVKTLLTTMGEAKKKLQHILAEKSMVQQMLQKPMEKRGVFRIVDRPQWGVNLNMFHFEKKLTPEDGKKEIRLLDNQLVMFSLAAP